MSVPHMKVQVIFWWVDPLRLELPHQSSAGGPLTNRVVGLQILHEIR